MYDCSGKECVFIGIILEILLFFRSSAGPSLEHCRTVICKHFNSSWQHQSENMFNRDVAYLIVTVAAGIFSCQALLIKIYFDFIPDPPPCLPF